MASVFDDSTRVRSVSRVVGNGNVIGTPPCVRFRSVGGRRTRSAMERAMVSAEWSDMCGPHGRIVKCVISFSPSAFAIT